MTELQQQPRSTKMAVSRDSVSRDSVYRNKKMNLTGLDLFVVSWSVMIKKTEMFG